MTRDDKFALHDVEYVQSKIEWFLAEGLLEKRNDEYIILNFPEKPVREHLKFKADSRLRGLLGDAEVSAGISAVLYHILGKRIARLKAKPEALFDLDTMRELSCQEEQVLKTQIKYSIDGLRKVSMKRIDVAMLNPTCIPYYDPIESQGKINWEGEDEIQKLLDTVTLSEGQEKKVFERRFRQWFVQLVRSASNDRDYNEIVLILSGKQGVGKTRFFRGLIEQTTHLNRLYEEIDTVRSDDRDSRVKMCERVLLTLDEFGVLSQRQLETIKRLTTMSHLPIRGVYQTKTDERPRIASFAGTTNEKSFLTDKTGNRRFHVFRVSNIVDFTKNGVNYDQLWAQAKHLSDKGFETHLTNDDVRVNETQSKEFATEDLEESAIKKTFDIGDKDPANFMTVNEIIVTAWKEFGLSGNPNIFRAGKILSRLGFEAARKRIEGKEYRGYYVTRKEKKNGVSSFTAAGNGNVVGQSSGRTGTRL